MMNPQYLNLIAFDLIRRQEWVARKNQFADASAFGGAPHFREHFKLLQLVEDVKNDVVRCLDVGA